MKLITEFYKGLDTLNLIIFWGIIIVIILLLIFSIIISNKNKKLKNIIRNNNNKIKETSEDIPIQKQPIISEEKNNEIPLKTENKENYLNKERSHEKVTINKENITNLNFQAKEEKKEQLEEEKFVAEEHVMEYNKESFPQSNIKKIKEIEENKTSYQKNNLLEEMSLPTGPYQRNVLREMSLNQTSPIGIVKPIEKENKEISKAKELEEVLSENNKYNEIPTKKVEDEKIQRASAQINEQKISSDKIKENSSIQEENTKKTPTSETIKPIITEQVLSRENQFIKQSTIKETPSEVVIKKNTVEPLPKSKEIDKTINYHLESINSDLEKTSTSKERKVSSQEKYLEEVSKVLASAEQLDNVNRTEYELQQEEDAIISYEELMQKKDSIKMVDEEEAVISIEELMRRKEQKEKLYKLTEDEENDMFIKELKDFRNDL